MLLEDCYQQGVFARFIKDSVCRGNLLLVSDSKEWYVYNSNPRIFVNCQRHQVKFVQFNHVYFLLAINDLKSRYNLFINKPDLLANIASLTVRDKVEVKLENEVIPVSAIIKYIGPLDGKLGTYFGIELLVCSYVNL